MVYKKYIKRGGKLYGPYTYHSKRIDGRVISEYHGKKNVSNKKTILLLIGLGALLALFLIFLIKYNSTGGIIFESKNIYANSEIIKGVLELTLEEGEFIPSSTKLIIELENNSYEHAFSGLIDYPSSQGEFYIKGYVLSGYGDGYGIENFVEEYPKVNFVLDVYKEEVPADISEEQSEDIVAEEKIEESEEIVIGNNAEGIIQPEEQETQEDATNEQAEITDADISNVPETNLNNEEAPITGSVVKEFFEKISNLFLGITGKIVSGKEVQGVVSADKPFVYDLSEGESARIVSSSEDVEIVIENNQAIVATDYIGDVEAKIIINLGELNIPAENGILGVSVVYEGIELAKDSEEIIVDNKTILNETIVLNETIINITAENITITTLQFDAVVGKPVKWKKKIKLEEPSEINIEIPADAENISVYKIIKDVEEDILEEEDLKERVREEISELDDELENFNKAVKEEISEDKLEMTGNFITGQLTAEIKLEKKGLSFMKFISKISAFLTGKKDITGFAVEESEETKELTIKEENATEFEIEYETPAPVAIENGTAEKKEITISSNIHYENILAYTELPKETQVSSIRLYNIQNESKVPVEFLAQDTNNNSLADIVYWIVPSLSNQTYLLIIEISKAEHLDENKNFIEDIYPQVRALDGVWSHAININEYIRVTFEQELDSTRDITLYPRITNGSPSIEVYEFNKTEVIAKFENLLDSRYNKVYLTNLSGQQDTFDLRIINGSLELDYIVDPVFSGCINITSSGTYDLTSDISDSSNNYCINISASDVILDCGGFTIDGNGTALYGVYASNSSSTLTNITIKNCRLSDFSTGIYLKDSINGTIINNVINLISNAIKIENVHSTSISSNNISNAGNDANIYVINSTYNLINSNIIFNSTTNIPGKASITVSPSSDWNNFTNNIVNRSYNAVLIYGSHYNRFEGNSFLDTQATAFTINLPTLYANPSHNITLINNTFYGNLSGYDIWYIKNENGTFINNTFSSPNSAGVAIIFGNSTNSRFIGNIFINKTSAFRGSPTNSYFSDSSAANVIGFISLLSISGAAGEVFYPLNNTFYNMTFTSVIRSITIENASFNNFSNIRFLTPISAISISLNSDSNIFENINITNSSDFSIVINDRSDNNIFDRIRISRPSNTGATQDNVFINVSENTTVRNSNFVSNRGNAIYAFNANGTKILNNVISNQSKNGIILNISNSIEIFHNTIRNNTEYGISLISSHFNNLINNTISLNNKSGIILTSSNSNDITNNTLMRNTESGIYLTSSNSNDITNNTITQNTESGIYLTVSNLNNFSYNTIDNNTLHGISLLSSNSSNIIGNLIRNNSRNGIVLNNSILNELLDNNFSGQGTATVTYYVSNSPRNYSGVPYWDYVSTPTSLYEINISGTFYEYWVTSSEQAISEIDGTFNLSMCLCYLPDVFGWNITMYVNKDLVNTTGCDNLLLNPPLSLPSSNCNYYEKDVFVAQGAGYDYDTNFNSSSQEITSGTAQSPFIDARQPGPYSSIEIINSDNTSISNNNLLNTKGRAVTIFGSDNILLDDSDIIGSGLISSLLGAIQIDPSSNITIRDSNISNNIGTGINISNNSLVYIINNTINNNTGYGINIEDNSTSTINENTICENTLGAINSVDSLIIPSFPEIVTVNNSICLTNENKLSINWFVQARTINASGNVTNATVNIYDLGNSTAKFTGLTGAFGLSDVVLVNQFIVNNSDLQINATPHNFTANKSAQTNESIIFIDSSRTYSRGNEIVLTLFACAGDYGAFSDWSDCVSGSQTRTRTDSTGCTQTETQSCSVTTTGGGGSCVPNCAGIECGPDLVCGESCGSCASGETCVDGICTEEEIICTEDWQCGWTVCAEDDISSYPYDCADLNNCGTFENMPDDAISCQERSQIEDETSGLGWSCSAWSECDAKYTIEDVLKEKISSSGQQSRSCKGSNNIERVEYKKCSLAIPIRISKSSWCHEEIVELFRNDTNEFVSRIQASEIIGFENLNRVDIFFATGEFTGYCSYCFNGVQDYDETSVDCGGENCPECLMKYDFFDWVFLVKIILLVLSIILLSFFYRRVGTEVEFGKKFIRLAGSIADFFKSNKARDRRIEQKITGVFKR